MIKSGRVRGGLLLVYLRRIYSVSSGETTSCFLLKTTLWPLSVHAAGLIHLLAPATQAWPFSELHPPATVIVLGAADDSTQETVLKLSGVCSQGNITTSTRFTPRESLTVGDAKTEEMGRSHFKMVSFGDPAGPKVINS